MPDITMVEIAEGAPERWRHDVAALYLDAFASKLGPVFGNCDAGRALLAESLDLSRCLVAREGGRLVGVAGYCLEGRRLVQPARWRQLAQIRGPLQASFGLLIAALLRRPETADTLLMDGIAVAADWRGQGVGGRLLLAIRSMAARRGRHWVRLDVIDSNPAARRLYERQGFVAVGEQTLGPPGRWLLGVGRVTTMRIAASPA